MGKNIGGTPIDVAVLALAAAPLAADGGTQTSEAARDNVHTQDGARTDGCEQLGTRGAPRGAGQPLQI